MQNPLIVALDTDSPLKALNLVLKLKITGAAFKVGYELFLAGGHKVVDKIVGHDVRVFLDLKFHDIPTTVAHAVRETTKMGVWMVNVHASGGSEMMKRAVEAAKVTAQKEKISKPLVMGVTILTSLNDLEEINWNVPVPEQVLHLATLSKKSGLDGVVCSSLEAALLRKDLGKNFTLVTPGIRPESSPTHDQKRTMTPREALKAGSNYLVMGRPITGEMFPLKAVDRILSSLEK